LKARHVILVLVVLAALAFVAVPVVFSVTSSGPMVAMPLILTRADEPITAKEIRSVRYIFRETRTSFERINIDQMKEAKPFRTGFLLDAPYTKNRSWMFGPTSTSPEYRSLTIQLALVDGETFTMSIPVLSDTALNSPIHLDISNTNK